MSAWIKRFEWYYDSSRSFLGPTPGSLVPLNIFGAMFAHSHSDASMRILHGYTSIGIFVGIISILILFISLCSRKVKYILILPLFIVNLWAFYVNTWVAANGMGIPHGRLFHLFLAMLIVVNFCTFRHFKNDSSIDINKSSGAIKNPL